jgi:hypothetical protein
MCSHGKDVSKQSGRDAYGGTTTIIQASLDQSQEYRGV